MQFGSQTRIGRKSKLLLFLVVAEAALLFTYRIDAIVLEEEDIWSFMVCMINLAFFVYLPFSAVMSENLFDLYGFAVSSILLFALVLSDAIFAIGPCSSKVEEPKLLCILGTIGGLAFQLIFVVLFYFIKKELGWRFYTLVGSDIRVKKTHSIYQGFVSALKIDVQVSFLMIFTGVYFSYDAELVAGTALSLIFVAGQAASIYLGYTAVQREREKLFVWFVAVSLLVPIYDAFVMAQMFTHEKHSSAVARSSSSEFTKALVIGLLHIGVRCVVMVFGFKLRREFGKGLIKQVTLSALNQGLLSAPDSNSSAFFPMGFSAESGDLSGDSQQGVLGDGSIVQTHSPFQGVFPLPMADDPKGVGEEEDDDWQLSRESFGSILSGSHALESESFRDSQFTI